MKIVVANFASPEALGCGRFCDLRHLLRKLRPESGWPEECSLLGMNREQLELRSRAFAVRVVSLCKATRDTPAWRSIADQLSDAATSAAANYRASARARSRAEFVAKLGIVNEESDETVHWLELMRDGQIGDRREVGLLLPEAKELRAIFAASYATARRNHGKK
jgi:four helix bundle protein